MTGPCSSWGRRGRRLGTVVCLGLLAGSNGCAYVENQLHRTARPDNRIVLGWQERRYLYERQMPHYTCPADYFLQCDRAGAITLSCTCTHR
jgi:hypothetical protein